MLSLASCTSDPPATGPGPQAPAECQPDESTTPMGTCCPAGTLPLDDGTCRRAGVPPELCAPGFEADGAMGCEPVLPAERCPSGWLALPGEEACREIASCGEGDYGDIPTEANTQFVDGSYAGGASDGSQARPWTTIAEGVSHAEPGAIIAIAAGSYAEDIILGMKPVRLWGRCPAQVELRGSAQATATISIQGGADGTEIRGLAITGETMGVALTGSEGVRLVDVWIHDTAEVGAYVGANLGAAALAVSGSLIEQTSLAGVHVWHGTLTLEDSVIREPHTAPNGEFGYGVSLVVEDSARQTQAEVRGCVVEQSSNRGIAMFGADTVVDATVVRHTQPHPQADIEGMGIVAESSEGRRATLQMRGSVLQHNHTSALMVQASDATIEATVLADTLPQPLTQEFGRGLTARCIPETDQCSQVEMRDCLLTRNREHAVGIVGSTALVDSTVVRDTMPQMLDGYFGTAIGLQGTSVTATTTLRHGVLEQSHAAGLTLNEQSEAVVEGTLVRVTEPRGSDGHLGDGIAVVSSPTGSARLAMRQSRIAQSARAGLSNFGGDVTLADTVFDCNLFDIAGERDYGTVSVPFTFDASAGGLVCGCAEQSWECGVVTPNLEPPPPMPQ